jgi:phage anti-repressor protein
LLLDQLSNVELENDEMDLYDASDLKNRFKKILKKKPKSYNYFRSFDYFAAYKQQFGNNYLIDNNDHSNLNLQNDGLNR